MPRVKGAGLLLIVILGAPACSSGPGRQCNAIGPTPITELVDPSLPNDTVPLLDVKLCESLAAHTHSSVVPVSQKHDPSKRPFNILVLSGGGAYGAYTAGVLAGWTENGTRPAFDVVTGISTGALVATLAFLGPERDSELKRFYTTIRDKDIYEKKSDLRALFSDSFRNSDPLAKLIDAVVDANMLRDIAGEHCKGRRLYVGTTELDARRLVVWDMGEIAKRGAEADLKLFRQVLLASASVPGYFPPVPINVEVDGKPGEELHVDGGVTASLFFRSPQVPRSEARRLGERPLDGSNLYIIVAGKYYADPACVERRLIPIAADSITALLYSKCRADLFQLYALALSTGMNYKVTAIPAELKLPGDAATFDPAAMTFLYNAGRQQALAGSLWRDSPPGTQPGEEVPLRGGTKLSSSRQPGAIHPIDR
jgi:predicted acylesterase/phospholipase RssA